MTQVLVVGAGPVGMTLAADLARYGVAVRIVDKAAARTDKSKALVLWSRTLELLDRAGCAESFVAAGHKVTAANIVAGGTRIGHVGFANVASPYPFALMLPQSDTERLLEAHLGSLGVRVERSVELTGFVPGPDGVGATLRHPDGSLKPLAVDWLVGCDGAHSSVRHGLGLPFEGDTLRSDWFLADVHVTGVPFPDTEMATFLHAEGVLVLFPIAPGRYRVIADCGEAKGEHPADPTLDAVQAAVDRRGPGGIRLSDPVWLSAFRINERKVADYRAGRVFVAGDAAHVHSPAGGQGMNTGMQDAINLAWKLALVCAGPAKATLLDSYSAERSAVGAEVLANAGRMTAAGLIRNPVAQTLRNLAGRVLLGLAPVRRAMADTLAEVTIGYPDSPLNGPSHGSRPHPGERVPPVAGQTPFGTGSQPRFALCAEAGAETARILHDHAALLEPAVRPPLGPGGAWLVRPDGYVAAVARPDDLGPIDAMLAGLRGGA